VSRLRREILAENRETVAAAVDAGRAVAGAIDEWPVEDPAAIRTRLSALVEERGLAAPLLGLVETGVTALGAAVDGSPVPAAPYLTITTRGPVCRAALSDGRRLVVTVGLFEVARRPRRYRFTDPTPETCLDVSVHPGTAPA